jgi:hypothetical protein
VAGSRSTTGIGPIVGASSSSPSSSSPFDIIPCAIADAATGVNAVGVSGRRMGGRGGLALTGLAIGAGAGGGFDLAFVVESPDSAASGRLGTGTFFWVT